MSKPDLVRQIITSQEARDFLQMVTKDFYNDSYIGLWIFEVIGREWDEMRAWAEGLVYEINPQTCTWSIAIWEWVYGIEPDESLSLEFRRQRILAKICAVKPINPEMVRRGVAALIGAGTDAVEVNDLTGPYRFEVILHPQETPFPYNRIEKFIREIKPSHLAFDTVVETKILIHVLIDTKWDLYGTGMTGMYNAGTRPDISIKAQLHDITVTAETSLITGMAIPERTGTVFAAEETQRMNPPSTVFEQAQAIIDVLGDGNGYSASAPWTDKEQRTGQYPSTSIKGRTEDREITAETEGAAAKIPHDHAGTIPDIQHHFLQSEADITAATEAERYKYTADAAGTKPRPATGLSLENVSVSADAEGTGYKTNHPETGDHAAGTMPEIQQTFRQIDDEITAKAEGAGYNIPKPDNAGTKPGVSTSSEQPIGGVHPIIEGESYQVQYPMCGTGVTKK